MMRCHGTAVLLLAGLLLSVAVAGEPRSGYEYIKPETRAMQDDDFENPGLLALEQGRELFNARPAGTGKACAACHGEDASGLDAAGIARYPVVEGEGAEIVTLQRRISRCRDQATGGATLPPDHPELVALETFVRSRARGEPVNVQTEGPAADLLKQGEVLYHTRYGLIDMACNQCHDTYSGLRIRGQTISQGQGNGFPVYRLGTGEITSLRQRIQQCLTLMRAEPFAENAGEPELLELYIMSRSNGLPIETPAVRY